MSIIMELQNVSVNFKVSRGPFSPASTLHAVSDVSLKAVRGKTLAIVGESGSGKTTLANTILNIQAPASGSVNLNGRPIREISRRAFSRLVQPVFQDPYSSLNPRRSIGDTITQPLAVHDIGNHAERDRRLNKILDLVGLPKRVANSQPHQLSGGQRQRVAIARALIIEPQMLVCDEPTSALDVSVQAQILNLLQDLREELGLTYILITHNLAVVEHIATEVAVMYLGRIIEQAPVAQLFAQPRHPYTDALLQSALTPDPELGLPDLGLSNVFPNPLNPPSGCHFHPRCRHAFASCSAVVPAPSQIGGHMARCHLQDTSLNRNPEH
jgi:peptide/nickel transport system ATP-binding protein